MDLGLERAYGDKLTRYASLNTVTNDKLAF
jgi:hypothetical protein